MQNYTKYQELRNIYSRTVLPSHFNEPQSQISFNVWQTTTTADMNGPLDLSKSVNDTSHQQQLPLSSKRHRCSTDASTIRSHTSADRSPTSTEPLINERQLASYNNPQHIHRELMEHQQIWQQHDQWKIEQQQQQQQQQHSSHYPMSPAQLQRDQQRIMPNTTMSISSQSRSSSSASVSSGSLSLSPMPGSPTSSSTFANMNTQTSPNHHCDGKLNRPFKVYPLQIPDTLTTASLLLSTGGNIPIESTNSILSNIATLPPQIITTSTSSISKNNSNKPTASLINEHNGLNLTQTNAIPNIYISKKYQTYRREMLQKIHEANGGQLTITNPRMRRTKRSNSSTSQDNTSPSMYCNSSSDNNNRQSMDATYGTSNDHDDNNNTTVTDNKNTNDNNNNEAITSGIASSSSSSNGSGNAGRDPSYFERRKKNNAAAKKSRDRRRMKEDELAIRAGFLEHENIRLQCEIKGLFLQLETVTEKLQSANAFINNHNHRY